MEDEYTKLIEETYKYISEINTSSDEENVIKYEELMKKVDTSILNRINSRVDITNTYLKIEAYNLLSNSDNPHFQVGALNHKYESKDSLQSVSNLN